MNNRVCDDCEHFAYCGCGPDCLCGVCLFDRNIYKCGIGVTVTMTGCTGFEERDMSKPMKRMKDYLSGNDRTEK